MLHVGTVEPTSSCLACVALPDLTRPAPPSRTGQFDVQTCFHGRYGAETITDQFGATVMVHAKYQDQQLATARIEYVEVTEAGQVSAPTDNGGRVNTRAGKERRLCCAPSDVHVLCLRILASVLR